MALCGGLWNSMHAKGLRRPYEELRDTVLRPPFVSIKLSKIELQPLVDKVAGNVPTCISSLLKKSQGCHVTIGLCAWIQS
jgi:hypothetical protein